MNEVAKKYQQLLDSPFPSLKSSTRRRRIIRTIADGTSNVDKRSNMNTSVVSVERTPSPITSVIMAARVDAEGRRSPFKEAEEATTSVRDYILNNIYWDFYQTTMRQQGVNKSTTSSLKQMKREKTPDFSQFNDPYATNVVHATAASTNTDKVIKSENDIDKEKKIETILKATRSEFDDRLHNKRISTGSFAIK